MSARTTESSYRKALTGLRIASVKHQTQQIIFRVLIPIIRGLINVLSLPFMYLRFGHFFARFQHLVNNCLHVFDSSKVLAVFARREKLADL